MVYPLQGAIINEKLYRKAETHFENREWSEALSMYNILLIENPKEVKLYVSSVVAASYKEAPQSVMHYVELSERNGVSLDSLFVGVNALTMAHRKSEIYENMLLLIKKEQPWLKKLINTYLLRFYRFRNDAPRIVEISDELLECFRMMKDFLNSKEMLCLNREKSYNLLTVINGYIKKIRPIGML